MRNAKYWQKRFEDVLVANEKTTMNYEKELVKIYTEYKLILEEKLESFFARYSKQTGLSISELKQRLNLTQLKSFKVQQKIYIDKVMELVEQGANLQNYVNVLERLSNRAYVSRLQELQYNLNTEIMLLSGKQEVKLAETLAQEYLQGYFSSTFALQQGIGVGYSFNIPEYAEVLKVLKTPWSGDNYSDIIWKNKDKLSNWLSNDLSRLLVVGASNQQIAKDLSKKLNVNYKDAIRLARTETNYISNQSTMDSYKESGVVQKYKILATLDERTSEICQDLDGKIFKMSEREVGVTVPPFHPYCRTTTIPYFEEYADEEVGTRIARDKNGKNIHVPADMTYKEWKKLYGIQ